MTDILISLDDLVKYCIRYDALYGSFPESTWEGKAVLEEVLEFLENENRISPELRTAILDEIEKTEPYVRD